MSCSVMFCHVLSCSVMFRRRPAPLCRPPRSSARLHPACRSSIPFRSVCAAAGLPATRPFFARIACAHAPAFAPARLCAPDCARVGRRRAHLSRPFRWVFCAGASREAKRPPDAASSCPILPRISQGQALTRNYFKKLGTKFHLREETPERVMKCHVLSCDVMRPLHPRARPASLSPRLPRAPGACLPGSCTLRNRKGGPGSRLSSTPSLPRFPSCQGPGRAGQTVESLRAVSSMMAII